MKIINNFLELKDRLNDNEPLSVIRFGNVEMTSLLQKDNSIYSQLFTNAGFFCKDKSNENEIYKMWKKLYVKSIIDCNLMLDVFSCNSFQILGDLLNKLNIWQPSLPYIECPRWWLENIIMQHKGTIGIVSYFKKDIEQQLTKMDKIWPDKKIKNKFIVVKSLNTIKGNEPDEFNDWLEVFYDLEKRVLKEKEPTLWLVSAGCYGMPICNSIKQNGGKAIYVGGLLQTIFGLRGKRWDNRLEVKRWVNKHWKYPTEKPNNAQQVENWCYGGDDFIVKK
jgi:hypothetical protein